ncbi:MAG: hypothetical protein FWH01_12590 [Oscillospiraceae bacterium]|nr:hypothetical protein [Oscillospiraceae bacterium]
MKICVISTSHSHSEHPWMDGDVYRLEPRILSVSAVSLLYDPNLIMRIGATPEIVEWDDSMPDAILESANLIIAPQAMDGGIEQRLAALALAGHKIFWVRPSAAMLEKATRGSIRLRATLHSHCERWSLPGGDYVWPQPVDYDAYEFANGAIVGLGGCNIDSINSLEGCWSIGNDLPSVVRAGNVTFGAGGVFHAYNWYWNSPRDTVDESGMFNAFQRMYLGEVARLLGIEYDVESAKNNFFIRRDFHAYGFARQMVNDLCRLKGGAADFARADAMIYKAAALVGATSEADVERALKPAFEELYRIRCELVDIPVYYAEALHAGILTDEYGFIEFASPEFVKDQIEALMYYARKRKGHFGVDMSIISLLYIDRRHPSLTKLIREGIEEGVFEVCNGSIGQPYPHLFSLESNIRQLETGQYALIQLYGKRASSFLAQEMQLVPSYPTLLKQAGYDFALHRIQNKGATVYEDCVSMNWRAPDGSEIFAVPTHYDNSQQTIAMVHIHWPNLIAKAAETYPMGVFTNLLDNTWNTPFREESNRACYYAPVFGEFVTYRELAKKLPAPAKSREYSRRDYMPELQAGTSVLLGEMRSMSDKLESIEKYMALTGQEAANDALHRAWLDLGAHQNHDNTVVFFCPPRLRYMWPDARGPVRNAPELYHNTRDKVRAAIAECEGIVGAGDAPTGGASVGSVSAGGALFDPLGRAREVTMVKRGSGEVLGLKRAGALNKTDSLVKLSFSAYGADDAPAFTGFSMTQSNITTLDNGLIRIEIDPLTGALKSAFDIAEGRELLGGTCARLGVGVEGNSMMLNWRTLEMGGVKQFAARLELTDGSGAFAGWADHTITIADGEKRVYFTTTFDPHNRPVYPERPSHRYSHARKTGLYAHFSLDKAYNKAVDCWLHQLDEAPDASCVDFKTDEMWWWHKERMLVDAGDDGRGRTQSAMGLVMQNSGSGSVVLHNDGAQIYEYKGADVMQLLWAECDYGTTISYAIEWTCGNPYSAMLDYQYDLLPVPGGSITNTPSVDNPDIWISSIRLIGGSLLIRLVETAGRASETQLSLGGGGVKRAEYVDLLGETQRPATIGADDRIKVSLEKYGVCTIKIQR